MRFLTPTSSSQRRVALRGVPIYQGERVVGIAGGSWVRNPILSIFSGPIQPGPKAQTASCTIGTGSISRGKAAGAWGFLPAPGLRMHRAEGLHVPPLYVTGQLCLLPIYRSSRRHNPDNRVVLRRTEMTKCQNYP